MISKKIFNETPDSRQYQPPGELSAAESLLDMLSLSSDDVVVAFGIGSGGEALAIARRLREMNGLGLVIACDFSRQAICDLEGTANARGLKRQLRAICLDDLKPFSLPVGTARADSAVAVSSLHTLDDPLPYLCEIGRILRLSGELIIADREDGHAGEEPAPSRYPLGPRHLNPLLREAGLEAGDAPMLGGYTWVIRAVKTLQSRQRARTRGLTLSLPRLSFAR